MPLPRHGRPRLKNDCYRKGTKSIAPCVPVTIWKQSLTKLNKIIALESCLHEGRAKRRSTAAIPAISIPLRHRAIVCRLQKIVPRFGRACLNARHSSRRVSARPWSVIRSSGPLASLHLFPFTFGKNRALRAPCCNFVTFSTSQLNSTYFLLFLYTN
jgi:hypothetical protein